MQCEPNIFKQKLYDEFERNSLKLLGVPGDRVREVLGKRGENIDADFEAAWDYGGASFMRISMSMVLAHKVRLEKFPNTPYRLAFTMKAIFKMHKAPRDFHKRLLSQLSTCGGWVPHRGNLIAHTLCAAYS